MHLGRTGEVFFLKQLDEGASSCLETSCLESPAVPGPEPRILCSTEGLLLAVMSVEATVMSNTQTGHSMPVTRSHPRQAAPHPAARLSTWWRRARLRKR